MPSEVGELPSWFNVVENVWEKFEVPDYLKAKLLMPKLTPHAKSLIVRLSLDEQDTYETLRDFLLKQYQLGSREYRARFMHTGKKPGETWISYTSRLNKKAQLTLSNPRDVKACKNCSNSTCFVSF